MRCGFDSALHRLAIEQREAVVAVDLVGLSYEQAANMLKDPRDRLGNQTVHVAQLGSPSDGCPPQGDRCKRESGAALTCLVCQQESVRSSDPAWLDCLTAEPSAERTVPAVCWKHLWAVAARPRHSATRPVPTPVDPQDGSQRRRCASGSSCDAVLLDAMASTVTRFVYQSRREFCSESSAPARWIAETSLEDRDSQLQPRAAVFG
jgi:hypothetical protein